MTLDSSSFLGQGWKIGFLGLLHMSVFKSRLEQEFSTNVIISAPSVQYKCRIKDNENIQKKRYEGKADFMFSDPAKFPSIQDVEEASNRPL